MNVIYAADENYAGIMMVSIRSLCRYNRNLNIAVIDHGIGDWMKGRIRRMVKESGENIVFLDSSDTELEPVLELCMDRGSPAQFSRLFLGAYVPDGWERALYLDCDTLIVDNLEPLYETDMKNQTIAGVLDAFGRLHKKMLGLGPEETYINSGVLLIDLKRWRARKTEQRLLGYLKEKQGRILQGDQGVINAVLSGETYVLPVRFNLVTYQFDFSYPEMCLYRKPAGYYSEAEIRLAKERPGIVHFTSSFASMRPWECETMSHPFADEWNRRFAACGLTKHTGKKRMGYVLWSHLPHRPLLYIAGILHAYIKPLRHLSG